MQNPWIFKHLVKWMEAKHYPAESIQAFGNCWQLLASGDSLPCPACFMNDDEQHLVKLKVHGEIEPLFCANCNTEFDIPIPA
ncbi:MAG TPA: hypothetical protein VK974_06190 [Methylophilaceae bacterium]|nr:hypothetical protein [Methylophilaceae bacterium]